jgi:hypothetical protein
MTLGVALGLAVAGKGLYEMLNGVNDMNDAMQPHLAEKMVYDRSTRQFKLLRDVHRTRRIATYLTVENTEKLLATARILSGISLMCLGGAIWTFG